MGAEASTPAKPPTLADIDDEIKPLLMRNVAFLAARDTSQPGRFSFADWRSVHSAMPSRLADTLWQALSGGDKTAAIDLSSVVRGVGNLLVSSKAEAAPTAAASKEHMQAAFGSAAADAVATSSSSIAYDEAAPWLSSLGRPSTVSPAPRSADGAARLLAEAAVAAWLVDLRQLEPLPELEEGTPRLLASSEHVRFLARALPSENRRKWRLLFTMARDGSSFTRFVKLTANRAPCLLVIRDSSGALFGGFAASPLSVAPHFGGSYGSFLFTLGSGDGRGGVNAVYRASGDRGPSSSNLVYLNIGMEQLPNGLAFGGNLEARFFGLWLRDDLETGRSCGPCATYTNAPCLSASAEFRVDEVEVWAVADDPPPPTAEELAAEAGENALTAAGVLSSKHEETRNFLAMAGRKQYAADLAPEPEAEAS